NAGTGPDVTLYYNSFPSNQMERWLDLYSERFYNPVFRSFQAELEVVYEEKNMYSDNFMSNLIQNFSKEMFKNHPYGQQPLIGTTDHLKNPSLTKMKEFYDTYYVPNNMSLILAGDFTAEEIMPLVEAKFGKWKRGEVPVTKTWEEKPFNGRELVEVKLTPIKLGILGFRTVPAGHPDEVALQIANSLLSNGNQTGLMDELTLENKVMAAQVMAMPYNDHGATIIFTVPKIIGQKLEEAEALMLAQVDKLKKGEFDDWMVDAAKLEAYRNQQLDMESIQSKALLIATAFGGNSSIDEAFQKVEKIKQITKEDVLRVANKYYGENYLAFFSKMGFPKKEKMEKPGFEPVKGETNRESVFAQKYNEIPSGKIELDLINFDESLNRTPVAKGVELFYNENKKNDIFTLEMNFGAGELDLPLMEYASLMMNQAGTADKKLKEFKNEFSKIGCTYDISSNDSYTTISLSGIDKNFDKAVGLIAELISNPVLEQDKMKQLLDGAKTERKMEDVDPAAVSGALKEFVLYGEKSAYLDRLSTKEIKKLTNNQMVETFQTALANACEIHYTGSVDRKEIAQSIQKNIQFNKDVKPFKGPQAKEKHLDDKSVIYFVHKKKAAQAQILFMANASEYTPEKLPYQQAFNQYYGGGFSGLVLQEIREYRSMAYGAGAGFRTPARKGEKMMFNGYIGTQADKTLDAIEIFMGLVNDMPEKSERISFIKPYLENSMLTERPQPRRLTSQIRDWQWKGYTEDPAAIKEKAYKELSFDDIVKFYNTELKNKAMTICIVADKKSIDMKELEKYGEVIVIKEKKLYKK
ncbi:MAG: insulinase family protein, partial [Bacteroidales bacterium]|nr:insulinase family protein [Bacteroidales bacterium]